MLKEHVYEEKITNAAEKPLSHINNLHNIRLCNLNPFLDYDIAFAKSKLAMGLSCLASSSSCFSTLQNSIQRQIHHFCHSLEFQIDGTPRLLIIPFFATLSNQGRLIRRNDFS